MTLEVAPGLVVGFVLAMVRAAAWLFVSPPFNTRLVPTQVKMGLAAALALVTAPRLGTAEVPTEVAPLIAAALVQVSVGLVLGFVSQLVFSAAQAAGDLIDLFGGFTIASAYDPLSLSQSSVFGRLYQLMATVLLFAIDGHLLLVRGFVTSFDAVPATGLALRDVSELLLDNVGLLFVAALEIAGPLLAALFLAEVVLGLLTRAAPHMNVFSLSFPFKILVTLTLASFALPLMPSAVSGLVDQAVRTGADALRALGGR